MHESPLWGIAAVDRAPCSSASSGSLNMLQLTSTRKGQASCVLAVGEHGNCPPDHTSSLHPHPAPSPGPSQAPAGSSSLSRSRFCSWAIVEAASGFNGVPHIHHSHPILVQPSPPDPFTSWGKLAQQTALGKKLVCPMCICLWNLEEEKDKGRAVLFLHSYLCFHSANSLFALLQSSTCLFLLPLLPAVYSTPHSHPVLLRSHPVLPWHFRPQAETAQVKNYSSIFTEVWPLLLLWRKK